MANRDGCHDRPLRGHVKGFCRVSRVGHNKKRYLPTLAILLPPPPSPPQLGILAEQGVLAIASEALLPTRWLFPPAAIRRFRALDLPSHALASRSLELHMRRGGDVLESQVHPYLGHVWLPLLADVEARSIPCL